MSRAQVTDSVPLSNLALSPALTDAADTIVRIERARSVTVMSPVMVTVSLCDPPPSLLPSPPPSQFRCPLYISIIHFTISFTTLSICRLIPQSLVANYQLALFLIAH